MRGSVAGWEGVELGYRFYAAGAVIRSTDLAFSVRCSPDPSNAGPGDPQGLMREFSLLFEKHPDLALAARRWATEAYGRIGDRADAHAVSDGEPRDRLFGKERRTLQPLLAGKQEFLKKAEDFWVKSGELAKFAQQLVRKYKLERHPMNYRLKEVFYQLSLDCGCTEGTARSVREAVMKVKRI